MEARHVSEAAPTNKTTTKTSAGDIACNTVDRPASEADRPIAVITSPMTVAAGVSMSLGSISGADLEVLFLNRPSFSHRLCYGCLYVRFMDSDMEPHMKYFQKTCEELTAELQDLARGAKTKIAEGL